MISIKNFELEDGRTDWQAYHEAQRQAGETCMTCGSHIFRIWEKERVPGLRECYDCKRCKEDKDAYEHDRFVRCPKCREMFDPWDQEIDQQFNDGDPVDMTCPACEHEFEATGQVRYSFESPAVIEEKEVEEES